MPRAILSVYDKNGLVELATGLSGMGWDLVASGGTARALEAAGLLVTPVRAVTQLPEMLGGRVKTLHPAIHAGILARETAGDLQDLRDHGYAPVDLVVCNLYPFRETVTRDGVTLDEAVEQIDIGGVALLRAAAKNFARVTVLSDPADYAEVLQQLEQTSTIAPVLRRQLAAKAFQLTRDYDTAIHAYLLGQTSEAGEAVADELPEVISLGLTRIQALRYGENSHQAAGIYAPLKSDTPLGGQQLGGKALSYNNLLDLDAAWRAVGSFGEPTVVVVKHLTPTGIASGETIAQAVEPALASDPLSAFGGVIATNRTVDEAFVTAVGTLFIEAIAAPDFTPKALQMLSEGRKNCRLLRISHKANGAEWELRSIVGGVLVQTIDRGDPEATSWRVVTKRYPTKTELAALQFGWKAVQHVKSNAIVLAVPRATVGIGGGLPSRVDAVELAVSKAGARAQGAGLASDAFFPFPDGIEAAASAGVTCVVQPGGSIRDQDVIDAANDADIAMVFTGVRHFRH